ncbi:MAG: cyclase family protein [Pseudomonadota bacterium]
MSVATILEALLATLKDGAVEIVDLTETLSPDFPVIEMPPPMKQGSPFRSTVISEYDDGGPRWYWNNITLSEHTGTHLDAPVHWVTGKDLPNNAVDTLPVTQFIAPACVVDCSDAVAKDKGFILTREHLEDWEREHGQIDAGSWVFLRSDWRKVADPTNWTNRGADGAHSPGPDVEAVNFLVYERDVLGFGTETIGSDAGQAFRFEPQYPVHEILNGSGRLGLQCMTGLDQLPPKGALILALPLKIQNGSGSPLRVLALVPSE